MSNSVKEIKRKIKSIKSTRQVTKAMELVATSKMKKAVNQAVNLRSYGYVATRMLSQLSKKHTKLHKFFQKREVKNVLVLLFSTDKGLCGGLNANLFKKLVNVLKNSEAKYPQANFTFATSGKKGAEFLRRIGKNVDFVFPAFSANPQFSDIFPISKITIKGFMEDKYDEVLMVYPDFQSILLQKAVMRPLLPFSLENFELMMEELGSKFSKEMPQVEKETEYKLEPTPEFIIDNIVPQLTEMQIYQAVLETAASEHSARMVAMQNATKAASDLMNDLVLTYNQARQAAITAEISEIAAGMAAVS